jgi:hypothetical protein
MIYQQKRVFNCTPNGMLARSEHRLCFLKAKLTDLHFKCEDCENDIWAYFFGHEYWIAKPEWRRVAHIQPIFLFYDPKQKEWTNSPLATVADVRAQIGYVLGLPCPSIATSIYKVMDDDDFYGTTNRKKTCAIFVNCDCSKEWINLLERLKQSHTDTLFVLCANDLNIARYVFHITGPLACVIINVDGIEASRTSDMDQIDNLLTHNG